MSEWREIEGYPDYQVSDDGKIKSFKYKSERIMKTRKDKDGYLLVGLSKNNNVKTMKVHRLVAETFIPNPDNLPVVRHLNDIPNDNRLENLAWGTDKDNTNDLIRNGRHCWTGPRKRRITVFEKDGIKKEYSSLSEGCKDNNVRIGHASSVARGKRNHTGGYKIYYK